MGVELIGCRGLARGGVQVLSTLLLVCIAFSQAATDLCQFSKYHEESDSLKASKQKLSPLVGKSYVSRDRENYAYTIGICTKVENSKGIVDLAALQQGLDASGQPIPDQAFDIGSLADTNIMSGSDWILLEYRAETAYKTHCNGEKKRTSIMIACDETIGDENARLVFIEEENSKEESCYYLFELKHKAVCPVPTGGSGLSAGSIFLIVVISLVSVYLIVGFLYSRFVLGAKGMEQIPNYEFWKDFGNLQADGCDFICRTRERRRAGGFGGIGDNQLESEEEVVRDENLLPM